MKRNELMNMLIENGYKVFEVSVRGEKADYFYTYTPNGAILYVQPEKWGGYRLHYQYQPSKETGTGCSCNDDARDVSSIEEVAALEQDGAQFAQKLHAKPWESWEHFVRKYWASLVEYKSQQ